MYFWQIPQLTLKKNKVKGQLHPSKLIKMCILCSSIRRITQMIKVINYYHYNIMLLVYYPCMYSV